MLLLFLRTYGVELAPENRPQFIEIDQRTVAQVSGLLFGLIAGILFGAFDIVLGTKQFRRKPYGFMILLRSLSIVATTLIALILIIRFWSLLSPLSPTREQLLKEVGRILTSEISLVLVVYLSVVSLLFSLIKEMNNKFGPGVLYKMLMGKYYHPQEEERIFMFLDLKSSTTYAEQLGHVKYSQLIQDCFSDLSDSVPQYKVEIYQYVGDEAVLTWLVDDGLEKNNCLEAYFDFMKTLSDRADHYNQDYGFVPEFKAGVNIGSVMVAEVGIIKREIAYHSDVLNTAARIQGQCNEYGKHLLISEFLANRLEPNPGFEIEPVGKVLLRGKAQEVQIFSVEPCPADGK